jgi:hypothetical protein
MLKIWLNWLQPSLGVLGVVLVLSNAVSAHAASKVTGKETSKLPNGNSQPQVVKPNGFSLPQQMTGAFSPTSGVSLPPDVAIRRLALDTIANSETKSPNLDTQASRRDRGNIVSFTSSPSPKSTTAHFVKHSQPQPLSSTGVYAPSSTAAPLVPGLFIGRSTGNAARFSPSIQPVLAPVAKAVAVPIATPKVVASAVVATPFPVMLPPQMPQSNSVQTVATEKTSPIVARSTTTVASGLQNILGGESSSQTGSGLDTTVASGLQNVLGNEPKAIQTDSMVALSKLVAPEPKTLPISNRGSLQLATSQSYVSAPEFDLPGIVASAPVIKSAQAMAKAVPVKNVRKDLSIAVVQRKNDYVTLMSDKELGSQSRSSWQTMSRSHSLGGLILGSGATNEHAIAALPLKVFKPSNYSSLGIFNPAHQY